MSSRKKSLRMDGIKWILVMGSLLGLLTGCGWAMHDFQARSRVSFEVNLLEKVPAPKESDRPIEILKKEDISRPYKVIGTMIVNVPDESSVEKTASFLKELARLAGGDALIDIQKRGWQLASEGTPGGNIYNPEAKYDFGIKETWEAKLIVWK